MTLGEWKLETISVRKGRQTRKRVAEASAQCMLTGLCVLVVLANISVATMC